MIRIIRVARDVATATLLLSVVSFSLPNRVFACKCVGFRDWGFVSATNGLLPSNAGGVLWWGELPAKGASDGSTVRMRELREGAWIDLPTEYEQVADLSPRGLWLFRPTGGFERGKTYELTTKRTDLRGFEVEKEQRLVVEIADKPLVGRDRIVHLVVSKPTLKKVVVAAAASCQAAVDAAQVTIAMDLPEEVEPFRDQLYYETIIDGDKKWIVSQHLCSPPVPGVSWQGPGRDLLYSLCEESDIALSSGLGEGPHHVAMKASLPGTDFQISTGEVELELRCPAETD